LAFIAKRVLVIIGHIQLNPIGWMLSQQEWSETLRLESCSLCSALIRRHCKWPLRGNKILWKRRYYSSSD